MMTKLSSTITMMVVAVLVLLGTPSAQGRTVTVTTPTTTATTTSCPSPVCLLDKGCRPFTGPDGCLNCPCPDYNCDDVTCAPDQECVMKDVECPPDTTPCFPQPTCMPSNVTSTISTTTLTTTPPCPDLMCGPFCDQSPELYYGCPVCGCSYSTCEDVCGSDDECVMELVACGNSDMHCVFWTCITTSVTSTISTTTSTTTLPCTDPVCDSYCDQNPGPDGGCPVCGCSYSSCEDACGPGDECVMEFVVCGYNDMHCLFPRCIPTTDTTTATTITTTSRFLCPMVTCFGHCQIVYDFNGCSSCDCPLSCEAMTCKYNEECVMQEVQCDSYTTPCSPQPTCIPITTTTPTTTDTTTITITTPETTPPCPISTCGPLCDQGSGPDGCPMCGCLYSSCSNCDSGKYCAIQEVKCPGVTERCYIQSCIPTTDTTTISTPPLTTPTIFTSPLTITTTTYQCPVPTCSPFCGYQTEPDGCITCSCPIFTCEDQPCGPDEECVMMQDVECPATTTECFSPRCLPITTTPTTSTTTLTTTPPCPIYTCGVFCSLHPGPDGCPICGCSYYTCEHLTCGHAESCVMQDVECPAATMQCFYPTCIPSNDTTTTSTTTTLTTTVPCAIPLCIEECLPVMGPDGCLICACPDYTCQNVTCNADQLCIMQDIECSPATTPDTTPCFRQPTCIQTYDSCTGTPNTNRCDGSKLRWFYNSSVNACQKFRYYGCTPSPNTFLSLEACEDNCTSWDSPICPAIACAQGCYKLNRKNKCSKCICPDPCKNVKCGTGKECKLREVNCFEEHCPTEPFCAANSCPEQPPCGIRCLNDLKTDENGCQLCECAV